MRMGAGTYFMAIAELTAQRATCVRRKVGAVLLDEGMHVLSTGYNGVPSGVPHCTDNPGMCKGSGADSGTDIHLCNAIHAEQNAIAHCRAPQDIAYAFVTTHPCESCLKLLLATPCKLIVYGDSYDNPISELWVNSGRDIIHVSEWEDYIK